MSNEFTCPSNTPECGDKGLCFDCAEDKAKWDLFCDKVHGRTSKRTETVTDVSTYEFYDVKSN